MVLRILSHFCGFQGLLEVTPIPCGLMEQTRNGPVARLVAGARAALPYGEGVENPEGGTEYPMRAARNNHAFAFVGRGCALACGSYKRLSASYVVSADNVQNPTQPNDSD